MVEVLRLHLLLVSLTVIEIVEVGDDNWHRQRDGQHTGDGAQRSDDLAPDSDRPTESRYSVTTFWNTNAVRMLLFSEHACNYRKKSNTIQAAREAAKAAIVERKRSIEIEGVNYFEDGVVVRTKF